MQVVAITGSIGCGKTTLAGLIRELGYAVYDVDKWCRRLYFEPAFLNKIQDHFPEAFVNGVFNKRALRNHVFTDHKALKKLEKLTHPFLKKKFLNTIHHFAHTSDILFVDVAILFEMGWDKYCTFIILADTDYETQMKRVMDRDHITREDFEKIIKVQINNSEKVCLSNVVIETNRPLGVLKADLMNIIKELQPW